MTDTNGPLHGVRVIEFTAKGPVPICTMLLADMGAEVIQIGRAAPGAQVKSGFRFGDRGKQEICVDLKTTAGQEVVKRLLASSDVLVEGFRPGVMERLGLGPEVCEVLNPRLVYTRITGWGQTGSRAQTAGHDINFLAVTGALDAIGTTEGGPVPPLNLLADFAGGSLHAAFGICAALVERATSGMGQTLDVAMTDGVLTLMTSLWAIRARGDWDGGRGGNFLDGGAPYYAVYRTQDGRYLAVGAMETQFRECLFRVLGLPFEYTKLCEQREHWAAIKRRIAEVVATRTQAHWVRAFGDKEACVTPVASMEEALVDEALCERRAFVPNSSSLQPAPSPRLSRTPAVKGAPVRTGAESARTILCGLGYSEVEIAEYLRSGAVR